MEPVAIQDGLYWADYERDEAYDCSGFHTMNKVLNQWSMKQIDTQNRRDHKIVLNRRTLIQNACELLVSIKRMKERHAAIS